MNEALATVAGFFTAGSFGFQLDFNELPTDSFQSSCISQWIGLREILQESPIFNGKIYGFL